MKVFLLFSLLNGIDLIVGPIIGFLVLFIAYRIKLKYYKNSPLGKYLLPALLLRLFGALSLAFIYQYYYGYGDFFRYFHAITMFRDVFIEYPPGIIEMIFKSPENYSSSLDMYRNNFYLTKGHGPELQIVRIGFFLSFISQESYIGIAFLFSTFAFLGTWKLFLFFYEKAPNLHFPLALGILFVPSVWFWGSGVGKDSITIGLIGFLTYSANSILMKPNKMLHIIIVITCIYLLATIREFILIALVPPIMLFFFSEIIKSIKNGILKTFTIVISAGLFIFTFFLLTNFVGQLNKKYSLERILKTAERSAEYLSELTKELGGSDYSLGKVEYTPAGMISAIPKGITVTLFRPYPWEVRKIINIPAAIEGFITLLVTLFIILRTNWMTILKSIGNPIILLGLTFSLTLAFFIGVTTYNFGTLVRYKIPCMPFYFGASILIYFYGRLQKGVT